MKQRLRAHLVPFGPFVTFPDTGNYWGTKVRCSVCGASGHHGGLYSNDGLSPWQRTHLRGHKPCDYCGQMLVVKLDGMSRVHTRCPLR